MKERIMVACLNKPEKIKTKLYFHRSPHPLIGIDHAIFTINGGKSRVIQGACHIYTHTNTSSKKNSYTRSHYAPHTLCFFLSSFAQCPPRPVPKCCRPKALISPDKNSHSNSIIRRYPKNEYHIGFNSRFGYHRCPPKE